MNFPCSADHEQDWQPHPVDPCSCFMCDQTYMMHPDSCKYIYIYIYIYILYIYIIYIYIDPNNML